MKRLFIIYFLFIFILIHFGCSTDSIYEDRLEGNFANDAIIGFDKMGRSRLINVDTIIISDIALITVSEPNRSDGKPCFAEGEDLKITMKTKSGDIETFPLDTEKPSFLTWSYSIRPYLKIFPKAIGVSNRNNGILELNPNNDVIVASYKSFWTGNEVRDTVYFSK